MGRGTFLYCASDDDNARRWSRMKLSPMMRATPIVAEQFPQRARDRRRQCPVQGAARRPGAPADHRRQFAGIAFADHGRFIRCRTTCRSGSRTAPAIRRRKPTIGARAIEFAKILKISTPLVFPGCKITKDFEAGSQEMPFVPCRALRAHAGLEVGQHARGARSGAPRDALALRASPAAASSRSITGRRCWPASNGARRTQRPGVSIDRFVSGPRIPTCNSWSRIAQEWLKARGDPGAEQTFICDTVGKAYRAQGESPPWEDVARSRGAIGLRSWPRASRRAVIDDRD